MIPFSRFGARTAFALVITLLYSFLATQSDAFTIHTHHNKFPSRPSVRHLVSQPPHFRFFAPLALSSNNDDDKFSFGQRIESIKCVVVGALSGGIAVTPLTALHDILLGPEMNNGFAQWEFDTDMGSLESALFAIVYRYCVRTDDNPMLNQGVIGAFLLVRTLSRIRVPSYCSAAPLDCGAPLGYFDWTMIQQGVLSGIESVALFGGAAIAMEFCFRRGYITKFPG